ncbi:hypothetical protein H8L32_26825 [Undibacterium sp. CY18W]|uniref:Cellulose biosynthesis protein BcsR n=1 Tax=Undibacterium hunanense TaxID=2762292 RepID=A0ABR6ZYZ7_9BURK|nr:cellulose biosynthesis protein BcsP [Undibacterium hunanense]MBC3921106.1 hypothetical protein [Undibacterium hunanense]
MDDDVKNLFQKFGQTTDAYREINRDADSEQARQRWPLLRDVRVNGAPTPKRVHAQESEVAIPGAASQGTGVFNPASSKAVAKPASAKASAVVAPATSLLAAAPVVVKTPPLKQILLKQEVESDAGTGLAPIAAPTATPAVAPAVAPAPASAFMSRNVATAPREVLHAAAKAEAPATSLFAQRQPVAGEPPKAQVSAFVAASPAAVSAKPSFFTTPATPVAPAVQTAPPVATRATVAAAPATASVLQSIGGRRTTVAPALAPAPAQTAAQPGGNVPVSAVFGRLAAKPEAEKSVETGVNSFFKKIFKP